MLKVLIVEDESILAMDLKEVLMSLGYSVVDVADNAKGAHLAITNEKPDLVLMDVNIKGDIDGTRLALEVFERYNIPVVHLTAFSDYQTIDKLKKSQSYGYLTKPYDVTKIYIAIELAINKHKVLNNSRSLYMTYMVALEQMEGEIVVTDLDNRVLLINHTLRKMLNISSCGVYDGFISNLLEENENGSWTFFLKINDKVDRSLIFYKKELVDLSGKKQGHIYQTKAIAQ